MKKITYVIEKKVGSLTDIAFQTNQFDFVYTCEAFEHAINIHGAFKELYRIVKPGGKLVIIDKPLEKLGQLDFIIYTKELEENDCDIKRGDYIGLQVTPEHMEYFIVTDDGRVNYDNEHTLWGTVPFYRSIKCAVVSDITETVNM